MQNFLKKRSSKKFFSTLAMLSLVMPGVLLQMPYQQEAKALGAKAGDIIGNQATASYKDTNNNTYNSTSNLVTTTIAEIYGVVLTPNGTVAAPGQTQSASPSGIVYYSYTLTNTGNTSDTYTISAETSPTDNTFTPQNVKVYYDLNGNGIVDTGDTKIVDNTGTSLTSTGSTISIPADGSIKLIAEYQVPAGATNSQVAYINVVADSVKDTSGLIIDGDGTNNVTGAPDTTDYNYNRTTVSTDAVVNVTKSANVTSIDPYAAATSRRITYTLNVNNTGAATANGITVVDAIPANTVFTGTINAPAGTTVEYSTNLDPDPGAAFTSTMPTASTVKRIRYTMTSLAANNNRDLTFEVEVNNAALAGTIPNAADYNYKLSDNTTVVNDDPSDGINDYYSTTLPSGGTTPQGYTNITNTTILTKAAAQISFGTSLIGTGTTSAGIQDPEFILTPSVPNSDKTLVTSAPAGTYVYYRNTITNRGNATDLFDITLDTANSVLPSGAVVRFYIDSGSAPTNAYTTSPFGYSPLLSTGGGAAPDTGNVNAAGTYNIITEVFIPSNTTATTKTLSTGTPTGSTIPVTAGTGTNFAVNDKVIFGDKVYTVASSTANDVTLTTAPDSLASGTSLTKSPIVAVKATSTNGGTPVNSGVAGDRTSDTTINVIREITAPNVDLANLTGPTTYNDTTVSLTQSAVNATVSYPLNIRNEGGSPDTYNLTGSSATLTGETVTFYPIIDNPTTVTAATSNTVTLFSATNYAVGDTIIINGQTFTIGSINTNTITFATGQSFTTIPANGSLVVERGNTPITSTNLLAPNAMQQVIAVVTPGTTAPATYSDLVFTATSTNSGSITNSVTDSLVIPSFRNFTLNQDRTGSVPPGGTLTYTHTITNTGNVAETFNITIPQAQNGLTYQLIDASGNVVSATSGSNFLLSGVSVPAAPAANTYTFTVKVIAPSNVPVNTVSSITVTATETGTPNISLTNTDVTTVVNGFIQLSKSYRVYPAGTGGTGGTAYAVGTTTVKPGEIIEYRIDYTNTGSTTAKEIKIVDLIPANTNFVPGSLNVNGSPKTDAIDDETGEDAQGSDATGAIFFVGGDDTTTGTTEPTSTIGGIVPQGGTGYVTFRVKVRDTGNSN